MLKTMWFYSRGLKVQLCLVRISCSLELDSWISIIRCLNMWLGTMSWGKTLTTRSKNLSYFSDNNFSTTQNRCLWSWIVRVDIYTLSFQELSRMMISYYYNTCVGVAMPIPSIFPQIFYFLISLLIQPLWRVVILFLLVTWSPFSINHLVLTQ